MQCFKNMFGWNSEAPSPKFKWKVTFKLNTELSVCTIIPHLNYFPQSCSSSAAILVPSNPNVSVDTNYCLCPSLTYRADFLMRKNPKKQIPVLKYKLHLNGTSGLAVSPIQRTFLQLSIYNRHWFFLLPGFQSHVLTLQLKLGIS